MKDKLKIMNKSGGFTLIEVLIYSLIVTVFLTFTLVLTYGMIVSSERIVARKELVENQKLILQKVVWALQNVSTINTPAFLATSSTLSIDKLNYYFNPIIFSLSASTLNLKNGATTTAISNSYVSVSQLIFTHATSGAIRFRATLFNQYATETIDTLISFK